MLTFQKADPYSNDAKEEFFELPQAKLLKAIKGDTITPRHLQQNREVAEAEEAKLLLMTTVKFGMGNFQKGATKHSYSLHRN